VKILLDTNLSPDWREFLEEHGWSAVHWSDIGDPKAADQVILEWARRESHVVFTHDLDFGRLLALTHERGPSVLQVRAADIVPAGIGSLVLKVLRQHQDALEQGALVVFDSDKSRARILPI